MHRFASFLPAAQPTPLMLELMHVCHLLFIDQEHILAIFDMPDQYRPATHLQGFIPVLAEVINLTLKISRKCQVLPLLILLGAIGV